MKALNNQKEFANVIRRLRRLANRGCIHTIATLAEKHEMGGAESSIGPTCWMNYKNSTAVHNTSLKTASQKSDLQESGEVKLVASAVRTKEVRDLEQSIKSHLADRKKENVDSKRPNKRSSDTQNDSGLDVHYNLKRVCIVPTRSLDQSQTNSTQQITIGIPSQQLLYELPPLRFDHSKQSLPFLSAFHGISCIAGSAAKPAVAQAAASAMTPVGSPSVPDMLPDDAAAMTAAFLQGAAWAVAVWGAGRSSAAPAASAISAAAASASAAYPSAPLPAVAPAAPSQQAFPCGCLPPVPAGAPYPLYQPSLALPPIRAVAPVAAALAPRA